MIRKLMGLVIMGGLALAGPEDNSLVIGAAQEPRVLAGDVVNVISNQAIKFEIENFLFAPMLQTNRDLELIPVVATEVPTVQNGRVRFSNIRPGVRRLEIDYTIRPEAVWSDGRAITTEDVALWFEIGQTRGVASTLVDFFERSSLRVRDARNFTVTLEPAYFYDLEVHRAFYAPNHIMRAEWDRAKEAAARTTEAARQAEIFRNFFNQFSNPQFLNSGRMVYSGAFTLTRWVPGSSLEMRRNPRFWIKPPGGEERYVQRVVYRFIQNTNSLLVAILGGGIDAGSSVSITFDQGISPQLVNRAQGRFELWSVPTPFFEHIEINQFTNVQQVRDLQLHDPRTRQALTLAMNREGIVRSFFNNFYSVAHTWVSPQNPMINPNVTRYPFNPDRARQLLAELGWRPGPDGILQRSVDGRTVRFELEWATTSGNVVRERIQQFVAENYRQVGIAVRIRNAPSAVVLGAPFRSRAQEGTWTGFLQFAFSMGQADDGVRSGCRDDEGRVVHIPTRENGFRGLNFGGWCNEEFDRLRNQAVVEFDANRRRQIFARMQEIWASEVAMIPLYFVSDVRVFRVGLLNYVSSTFASSAYPTIEPWLIGWRQRGAQQVYDQARYAQRIR
jgi:peptide/nickel transport system substrate-binding protein